MADDTKLAEESKQNSVQIIFKMPEAFMQRFDRMCEQLGYTRTEAIREAMRRFEEQNEQRLNQRPDIAAENASRVMAKVWGPIFEMTEKARAARTVYTIPVGEKEKNALGSRHRDKKP